MPEPPKLYYWRNLPHWQPPGANIFLTFQLNGSLPRRVRERLIATRTLLDVKQQELGKMLINAEHDIARKYSWCSIKLSIRLRTAHYG